MILAVLTIQLHYLFFKGKAIMAYDDLKGKICLLTGVGMMGDTGIGQLDPDIWGNGAAMARVLYENGVKVFACDLVLSAAENTKKLIEEQCGDTGGLIDVCQADCTKAESVKKFVDQCMAKYGRIDLLVNNVGRSAPGGPAEMDEKTWDFQTDVNLKSVYLTTHEVIPIMEKQGGGVICSNASTAALRYTGKPQVAYAATKAAVVQFTATSAVVYAKKGIRLNCVSPGLMNTPLVRNIANKYFGGDYEGTVKMRDDQVPLGKMGSGFDVANGVVFLCSDKAKYITGHNLVIDGGHTLLTP